MKHRLKDSKIPPFFWKRGNKSHYSLIVWVFTWFVMFACSSKLFALGINGVRFYYGKRFPDHTLKSPCPLSVTVVDWYKCSIVTETVVLSTTIMKAPRRRRKRATFGVNWWHFIDAISSSFPTSN